MANTNPPTKRRKTKKNSSKIERIICILNVPYHVCRHLIGENHSPTHRMGVGAIVMAIGVAVAKVTAMGDVIIIHFCGDMLGYFIHGIGTIPFVEYAIPKLAGNLEKEEKEEIDEEDMSI